LPILALNSFVAQANLELAVPSFRIQSFGDYRLKSSVVKGLFQKVSQTKQKQRTTKKKVKEMAQWVKVLFSNLTTWISSLGRRR